MKKIYILRHAKAEHNSKIDDHERPLSQEGGVACQKLAAYMQEHAVMPDIILCSPSNRTKATVENVAAAYPMATPVTFIPALYLASSGEILREINALNDEFSSVLVVGHNPGLHHLAVLLAGNGSEMALSALRTSFPPAGLAVFECAQPCWQDIEAGSGILAGFFKP